MHGEKLVYRIMALKEKILLNCEGATALVEKQCEKKLSFTERIGLWIHMAYCGFCKLFYKQSKILDDSAKAYADRVSSEQKTYKLNPEFKVKLNEAFDTELKK